MPFMQRALIAGVVLGVLFAVLGVFVVLKKMSFFSEGIAHASLAGVAIGVVTSFSPLLVALLVAVLFAVLIYFLEEKFEVSLDAAIGILFTAFMSFGLILISTQPGFQPELMSFLFGSILAIDELELVLIASLSVIATLFVFRFLKELVLISLDSETAKVSGINVKRINLILYILLAVSVVLGIKILGIILVSALLIIPVSTAKIFASSFRKLIVWSVVISELSIIAGIFLSYLLNFPAGPTIVLVGAFLFLFISLLTFNKKL